MLLPCRQMKIPTQRPDTGSFLLCLVQAPPQGRTQGGEGINVHRFQAIYVDHDCLQRRSLTTTWLASRF